MVISISGEMQPSIMRTYTITPRKESYWLSNMRAFSGAEGSPEGAGTFFTMSSKTASTFIPFFADISGASSAGIPIISSISSFVRAGSAEGRSILLMTGRISKS